MKKAIKHITLLCMLLLFGNGQLMAHFHSASLQAITSSHHTNSGKSVNTEFINYFLSFHITSSFPENDLFKRREITTDNEEEDVENASPEKKTEKLSCYSIYFKQQPSGIIPTYKINNSFALREEFCHLYTNNPRYILFEVFRI